MPAFPIAVDRIRDRLKDGKPLPRSRFQPELSYGRHRGPAGLSSRRAAVAVTLYRCPSDGWVIPLTLRPHRLQHHGGQVCFPGGRVEPGESISEAAFREFREELGVRLEGVEPCGQLSPQYVYASDHLVHPVVAIIDRPKPWKPDPVEVDQVIVLPVARLMEAPFAGSTQCSEKHARGSEKHARGFEKHARVKRRAVMTAAGEVDQLRFRAPAFESQGHVIWGATALILDQLAQILAELA